MQGCTSWFCSPPPPSCCWDRLWHRSCGPPQSYLSHHTQRQNKRSDAACPWTNSKQSLWKRPLTFCNGREETSILRQKPLTHPRNAVETVTVACVRDGKEPISGRDCAAWHPSPERREGIMEGQIKEDGALKCEHLFFTSTCNVNLRLLQWRTRFNMWHQKNK